VGRQIGSRDEKTGSGDGNGRLQNDSCRRQKVDVVSTTGAGVRLEDQVTEGTVAVIAVVADGAIIRSDAKIGIGGQSFHAAETSD
jgi:hypothetical protein